MPRQADNLLDDNKVDDQVSTDQASQRLRALADLIDSGHIEIEQKTALLDRQLRWCHKLKLKKGAIRIELSLRIPLRKTPSSIRHTNAGLANLADDKSKKGLPPHAKKLKKPPYKKLKKAMQEQLRDLHRQTKKEHGADTKLLSQFLQAADLMTQYRDKGDAGYKDFRQVVAQLEQAAKSEDADAMNQALRAIEKQKQLCHRRFK